MVNKRLSIIVILFGILAANSGLRAEIRADAFNLTPQLGGYLFEGNQNLETSVTYGLGLGYAWDRHWATEFFFNYIDSEFDDGGGDVDGYLLRLDALYHFFPENRLVPFVAAGVGSITLDPDSNGSDTSALVNAGGGLKYLLTDSIGLRGDVRYVVPFDETHSNLLYTFSIDFMFGGRKKLVTAAAPPPSAPKDSDGDGVYDDRDRCPDTPLGVKVDTAGCPKDSDQDGVSDDLDKCPGTPSTARVDADGCPLDSDGDGVNDHQDRCPDTPSDHRVDSIGCSISVNEKVSITLNIEFETDTADIDPDYHSDLKQIAEFLSTHPGTTAIIEGHTDNQGPSEYNMQLSQKRAESVRAYLIEAFGIDPDRLTAEGYGETRPVATNETREGRRMNRRVDAVFTAEKTRFEKK